MPQTFELKGKTTTLDLCVQSIEVEVFLCNWYTLSSQNLTHLTCMYSVDLMFWKKEPL